MVYVVCLHLAQYFQSIAQRLWHISKNLIHLLLRLEPFLLGIQHTTWVVQLLTRTQANQSVVCLGILLIHKMHIVRAHQFHVVFGSKLNQHPVYLLLNWEGLAIGSLHRVFHLMALQFQIVVIPIEVFEPLDGFLCLVHLLGTDIRWYFASNAGGATDDAFVVFLQVSMVSTWTHIKAIHPRTTHNFNQIMIARRILRKQNQVPTATVYLTLLLLLSTTCTVHLATKNRFEIKFFVLAFQLLHIVEKLLDSKHIAMVSHSHALHAVGNCLVNEFRDGCLTIKYRVLGMYV